MLRNNSWKTWSRAQKISTLKMAAAPSYMTREQLATLLLSPSADSVAVVDVRDDDYVGGHIKGCQNVPSSSLDYRTPDLTRTLKGKGKVVFHCTLSQQRGPSAARRYLAEKQKTGQREQPSNEASSSSATGSSGSAEQEVYILDGGFTKWQEK